METWNPITMFGVEVSDFGNVRNLKTKRWIRPYMTGKGYLRCGLRVNGKVEQWYVHQLVLLAFIGPCPWRREVGHKNGVPTDNRLCNLEYVTSSENKLQAVEMRTWPLGSKRWNARLSEPDIPVIRQLHAEGLGLYAIAERFGVSHTTIYHVIKGHNWKHV